MNATPPPSDLKNLDSFETALLTELREHVATRPAVEDVPGSHPTRRRYGRWATGFAVAAAAATAFVIASPGGPGASPAYAVSQAADGDVVVTIHRLEDSAGLEAALAEHGIDAEVNYDPNPGSPYGYEYDLPEGALGDEGGTVEIRPGGKNGDVRLGHEPSDQASIPLEVEPSDEMPDSVGCGTGEPATLSKVGVDWVLRIPADSPAQDRPVKITTSIDEDLMVGYAGDAPDSYCYVASMAG